MPLFHLSQRKEKEYYKKCNQFGLQQQTVNECGNNNFINKGENEVNVRLIWWSSWPPNYIDHLVTYGQLGVEGAENGTTVTRFVPVHPQQKKKTKTK